MNNTKANMIMAGTVFAGTDPEEVDEIKLVAVLRFDTVEELRAAIQRGSCEFDLFRTDKPGSEIA